MHPEYSSCIGNLCEYHVFTKYGIQSLINVINQYLMKYRETEDIKYNIALKKYIIPSFQSIINEIIEQFGNSAKVKIKNFIKENINE